MWFHTYPHAQTHRQTILTAILRNRGWSKNSYNLLELASSVLYMYRLLTTTTTRRSPTWWSSAEIKRDWSKTWLKYRCKNSLDVDWSHVRFWSVMTAPEWTSLAVVNVVYNSVTVGTRQVLSTIYGTEWPIMCWCAVKKLLTHSPLYPHTASTCTVPAAAAGTVLLWLCTISFWMSGAAAFEAHVDLMLLQSSIEWTLSGWSIHSAANAKVTQRSFEYLTAGFKCPVKLVGCTVMDDIFVWHVGLSFENFRWLDVLNFVWC